MGLQAGKRPDVLPGVCARRRARSPWVGEDAVKNLVIRNKLLAGFAALLFVLLGMAGLGVSQLGSVYDTADEIAHRRLPINIMIGQINAATSDYLTAQRDEILDLDAPSIRADQVRRAERGSFVQQIATQVDAKMKVPQAKQMLSDFVGLWNDYRQATVPVSALAAVNKNVEALALLRKAQPVYERAHNKLIELNDFQKKLALESSDRALDTYHRATWLSVGAVGVAMAMMAAILIMLVRSVASPIGTMTSALDRLAHGDMNASVPDDDRRDEVGKLATAMKALRDQLAAAERAKQEQANLIVGSIGDGLDKLAHGDLTARVDVELTGVFAKLKTDFNNAMEELSRTLGAVSQSTGGVHTGAGEISQASNDLSRRTEQQAARLEETAAAMDEITATVRASAESAARANKAAAQARSEAEQSGTVVNRAMQAMSGIERSSAEISEIISVIDGIAFQTNLLALNAGVEAARAGDAGKGFAVVASEVRALAQRSAEAARDVKARITASSEQVEAGVSLVGETGAALNRIIGAVAEVDGLVAEITAAAEQQAAGLQQVNTAVAEMDGVTQQNAAMVEEATAAARSLAAEADQLAEYIGRFKLGAQPAPAAARNPVHQLQARAGAPKRAGRPAMRSNTALAVQADEDWAEF